MKALAQQRRLLRAMLAAAAGFCLLMGGSAPTAALAQSSSPHSAMTPLPPNWRDIKEGVGGYPTGPMLEIALRRTHSDKLEMFKWRSESIAILSAQPGPLVEREWHSLSSTPEYNGTGVWTGMTWWESQQRWHDMANVLFTTQIAANWMKTLDMTLIFVKPFDKDFDLRTLAQSGTQVLELGLLVLPSSSVSGPQDSTPGVVRSYLDALKKNGAETYRFAVYPNPSGFDGPFTTAYNKNGPPSATGEKWVVYMATYPSEAARSRLQSTDEVKRASAALSGALVKAHSDVEVMTRSTSQVCIHKATNTCSVDPDVCHVGVMGSGDTWASSCAERPQPCETEYNMCSMLPPRTCTAIGGARVSACPASAQH